MKRITDMLKELHIPFAYHHFAEGESPDPPFIIYLCPGSDNMYADDTTYFAITDVDIELYTDKKDIRIEKKVEDALNRHGFPYSRMETYIPTERLYEVVFSTQLLGGLS